jgi:NSS family neurotransmitter:Na+ symporter
MTAMRLGVRDQWRSRTTFVLALSASAVGLGNIWRFSYVAGEQGGAPFVVSYILCLFLVAVPLMVAEIVIGSHGRGGPVDSLRWVADRSLLSRGWSVLGWLACATGILILGYYAVVAGWALAYAQFLQGGQFSAASAQFVGQHFATFLAEPGRQIYWLTLFLGLAGSFVLFGVRRGLGVMVWLAVPCLLALLAVLVKFSFDYGDLPAARDFLFSVKWVDFSRESTLVALGHAFFTLGIGVGTGISYGAYAPARIPIGRSVMAVAVFDTMIALLVGLAVFPLLFANNVAPSAGPGLLFISLPYAFGNMYQGELFGALFFLLVVVAALGSAVALLEPPVRTLIQQARLRRLTAVLLVLAVVWLIALAVVLGMSPGEDQGWLANGKLFVFLDRFTAQCLLPLVSLGTALLVGWRLKPRLLKHELYRESDLLFTWWYLLLRYFVPTAIGLLVFAALIGAGA